jgi:hypothetical protein
MGKTKTKPADGESTTTAQIFNAIVADLTPDPENVRQHDRRNIQAIINSLRRFGQQKPIVIDRNNVVVAGNGTLQAAKELGWSTIMAIRTELEGNAAKAFAIADNRTAELADWDGPALWEAMKALQIEEPEMASILEFDEKELERLAGITLSEHDTDSEEAEMIGGDKSIFDLKPQVLFPSSDDLGFPDLKPDMIAELPKDMGLWFAEYTLEADMMVANHQAGRSTKDAPADRCVLVHYVRDEKLEPIWSDIVEYTIELVRRKWYAVGGVNLSTHDSLTTMESLWQIWRKRWMERYWQEAGIKVVPDIDFCDDRTLEYVVRGLPERPNSACIQLQTGNNKDNIQFINRAYQLVFSRCVPKRLLVYGANKPNQDLLMRNIEGKDIEPIFVPSVNERLKQKLRK